ncbi:M13 family metallopeptidase [Pseudohongiella acticola]|jgi:putative endopeptidase|nr:M13-type metalloendopeptidase [Pseudohongiella acticola]
MFTKSNFKGKEAQKAKYFSSAFSSPFANSRVAAVLLPVAAMAVLLSQCAPEQDTPAQQAAQAPATQASTAQAPVGDTQALGLGVDLDNMDRSVRPQDDFFQYVNGGWVEQNPIPADRSRWGSFDELREAAELDVLDILHDAASSDAAEGTLEQKIGDMYTAFMNAEAVEALGAQPLADELAQIDSLGSHDDLLEYWAGAAENGRMAPFGYGISQDQGQSDQYITTLGQSGLGLPDRDYYLDDSERYEEVLAQYQAHISEMFALAGLMQGEAAEEAAGRVIEVEGRIAQGHWTRVQNRDRTATYNRMSPDELMSLAPDLAWNSYLNDAGLPDINALVVRQPTYMQYVAGMFRDISVADWQHYHRYHQLRMSAPYLSEAFVEAHFDFFGRTLSGQPEMRSREKRAVDTVDSVLGFAVGQLYVEENFQAEARERMDDLVKNLLASFEVAIDELAWMTEATKEEAQAKLARLNTKIAYPDEWRDYDCLRIDADDLIGNVRRANRCEYERMMARLGQPVDREEWFMTPQTVNAYYSSTMNEIVFPAAILQPPFFNVEADDAINYGAIGAVIGHEITHAFDDQGRRSDGDGNLRDWWADLDEQQFRERADLMVAQFDAYEPIEGMNIQGALALGENIADLGGLTVSYQAWQRSLNGEPSPVIEGFSGRQRYFMGWGQIWRIAFRDEALRRQLTTGPHAPGQYRVRGALSNMPEFYEAFDVVEGDGMYRDPDVRVKIW